MYNETTTITQEFLNIKEESNIYSNPFEKSFTIKSIQDDVFILQSINGTLIGEYFIKKGETKILTNLSKGMYIGTLRNQSQTFKIVKK